MSLLLAILGAVFLFTYGSRSFLNIFKADGALTQSSENITSLNPHVYIDMVAILGAIGGKLAFSEKIAFLFGALSCSFIWFFGIGYGAGFFAPYLAKRRTWQMLDFITGVIMFVIAASLVMYAWRLIMQL